MVRTYESYDISRSELEPLDKKAIMCSLGKALLFPPYTLYSRRDNPCCNCEFWLCVALTLFGYFPGLIYAVCTIYKEDISKDGKNRRVAVNTEESTAAAAT